MVKTRIRMNIRAAVMAVLAVAVVIAPQASAQTTGINKSTNVLKVTPVRTDIEVKPGETKFVKMTVTNVTGSAIVVRPIQNDFIAGDERGTPALILDENKSAPTHSLKKFMKPLENMTIPAKEAKSIDVAFTVPKGTQAGGYFGAVRFAPTDPNGGGQVNLSASVASIVLLTVPGETKEKLSLTDFNVQQDGKSGNFFQTPDNLQITARFQNQGNLQAGPFGKVSVKKGDKVVYDADFNNNTPREMILPDSARRWEVPLKNIDGFGNYTVVATFTYGTKNQTIEVERSFWVVPVGVMIAIIAGTLLLIGLIVGIWMFLRSYKKRILKQHAKGSTLN